MLVLYHPKTDLWKIADFGMTAEGSGNRALTTVFRRGTPSYRAPEIHSVSVPRFTTKVDIWAIGCISHELVSGRKAFAGDFEVIQYAASGGELQIPPLPFPDLMNNFMSDFLRACLGLDVSNRPSAAMLVQKLVEDWPPSDVEVGGGGIIGC